MAILSAFADEISPDLDVQMEVCASHGINHIDVRAIDGTNVSKFTVEQATEYAKRMSDNGFKTACLGSPLGKIRIDQDLPDHLELTRRCCEIAHAMGTDSIRMFSFYPPEGGDVTAHRGEVMDMLAKMAQIGAETGILMMHENESNIYGDIPERVVDIFHTVQSEYLKGIFDPANFVTDGVAPFDEGWKKGLSGCTERFHIKDKIPGDKACVPAGDGHGQIEQTLAAAKAQGFDGLLTLEPHLFHAGQFAGFTGPEKFAAAVAGIKKICDKVGLSY